MQATNKEAPKKLEMLRPFRVGDIIEGIIIGIGRSSVYLNVGPQGTGIIFGREFLEEKSQLKGGKEGDTIAAKIVELENDDGYIELSLREAGREISWEKLKEQKNNRTALKGKDYRGK